MEIDDHECQSHLVSESKLVWKAASCRPLDVSFFLYCSNADTALCGAVVTMMLAVVGGVCDGEMGPSAMGGADMVGELGTRATLRASSRW